MAGRSALAKHTARDAFGGRLVGDHSRFIAKADMRNGDAVIALAGDSTGDETAEWFSRGIDMWLVDHPWITCTYNIWNDATGTYTTSTKQTTNAAVSTVWSDTFTRTAADLYGTTPDTYAGWLSGTPTWSGGGTAPGSISLNGTKAVITSDSVPGPVLANHGVQGDVTVTASGITINTSTQRGDLWIGAKYIAGITGLPQLYLYVHVASDGSTTCGLWRIANGRSTGLGAVVSNPVPTNATTTFDASIQVQGLNVNCVVNGNAFTRTLDGVDAQALAPSTTAFLGVNSPALAGVTIDSFTVTAQPAMQNVRVYNGSMPGSRLDYQQQRLAKMYPEPLDLLMISSSHNYTTDTAGTYRDKVQQFAESFRNLHPQAGVTLVSQNPEFPPSSGAQEHNARIATLKSLAAQHNYGYLASAEAFLTLPDRGRSLTRSDGVHPLGQVEVADPNNGSYLWATIFRNYLTDLSAATATAAVERTYGWTPPDMGWKAWAFDPGGISTASNWTSGTLQVIALVTRRPMTVSSISLSIGAVVATPTTGQNLVGIYQGGTRLAQSADQSTTGFASTGRKDIALTAPCVVAPGIFYVVILSVATTTPQIHTGGSAGAMNSATVVRWGTANTGQTTLPATLGTITGATPNQRAFWAAVG